MSYRSDHEAALMRVDALEQEVERLRSAAPAPTKPATKPRSRASVLRVGIAMCLISAGLVAFAARDRPTVDAAPAPVAVAPAPVAPVPVELPQANDLHSCIAAITPVTRTVDETTTDPQGRADPTAWIASTGARCRSELRAIADGPMHPDLRLMIRQWADAEDKLADPISMITVYYGGNPYQLDDYRSAGQLWREYHRARVARDGVLGGLRLALAK